MPIGHSEMLSGRKREQKMELTVAITREVSDIATCTPESVRIIFSEVDRNDWATAGRLAWDPQRQN